MGRGDSGALRGHHRTQFRNRHCSRPVHIESDSAATWAKEGYKSLASTGKGPEPDQIKEKLAPFNHPGPITQCLVLAGEIHQGTKPC